jgi:hypothetical protein
MPSNLPFINPNAGLVAKWRPLLLLLLLLGGPSAWAQTYIIGTDQTTCAGTIYDSGGANGNYSNGENLTTVLTPATAGAKIRLTFASLTVESCCDDLSIYDGPTTSSRLIGTYTSNPGIITATNATGQLTLMFGSDGSVNDTGFEAAISCAINVPDIISFTPNSGSAGTSVVITGTNFTGTTAVSFNGTPAPGFVVNSATQITVNVPAGAISGPVSVTNPNGTGVSAISFNTGTIIIGSNMTACSGNIYDSGGATGDYSNDETLTTVLTPATAGAKMRLTFTSFAVETCCDELSIYDGPTTNSPLIGTYTSNPGTITATNATGQLTLVFDSDGSTTDTGFEAAISCALDVPNITSFTPNSGSAGTSIVITGTNFTGTTAVSFNGTPAPSFVVNSATQITVTVPAGALSGPVSVTAPTGTSVSGITFNTGLFIIGSNFTACSGTIYDSGGATGDYSSGEDLTTVLTPGTAGSKVRLIFSSFAVETCCDELTIYDGPTTNSPLIGTYTSNPGTVVATNSTGELTLVFTSDGSVTDTGFEAEISCVTNVPSITSFTPASGLPGTTVVITGVDFTGATAVTFDNTAATSFTVDSPTQITAVAPTGVTTGLIRVTTPIATATSSTPFTVPAPTVTSFTPTSGPAGTTVVITGTNFTGATGITVGGSTITTFTVNSATQITLTIPPNAFTGPIVVTTPGGTGTSTATYNTGNATYIIGSNVTACSGTLFDSGGPTGNYSSSENLTTVITSATGSQVVLDFTDFEVEVCCDDLSIYDGPTTASPLIGTYTSNPGTITASGPQLTLVFSSDGSVVRRGFAAGVSCLDCATVTNAAVTALTSTSATVGFTPGFGNASYTVTYTATGGTAQTIQTTTPSVPLTGLLAGTVYTVSIQPLCPVGTSPATTFTFTTLLANDEPAGAIAIPLTAGCTSPLPGSNLGATTTTTTGYNVPGCGVANAPLDVWFTFTTAATGPQATEVFLNVAGSPAGQVRVFSTPGAAGPFNEIACSAGTTNNTAAPSFPVQGLTPSTTYYVAVSGFGSTDIPGGFTLCASQVLGARAAIGTGKLSVSPNPAHQAFTLTLPAVPTARTAQVTVINSLGQTVRTRTVNLDATGTQVQMEVPGLATGLYTLRVQAGGQVATTKVAITE